MRGYFNSLKGNPAWYDEIEASAAALQKTPRKAHISTQKGCSFPLNMSPNDDAKFGTFCWKNQEYFFKNF